MKVLHSSGLDDGGSSSVEKPSVVHLYVPSSGEAPVEPLQWNINRWHDPVPGRWIDEEPIGLAGDDEILRKYVGG